MGLSPRGGPTGEVERGPRHAQGHPQPLHCSLSGCGACVLGRAQTGGRSARWRLQWGGAARGCACGISGACACVVPLAAPHGNYLAEAAFLK